MLRATFLEWYSYIDSLKRERYRLLTRQNAIASAHFRAVLIRKVWRSWKLYRKFLRAKANSVCGTLSRYWIPKHAFRAWKLAFERSRRKFAHQLYQATPLGNKCIKKHFFKKWVEFLKEMRIEREIRHRSAAAWQNLQAYMNSK